MAKGPRRKPKSKDHAVPPLKKWNVFVYLAGDNNLSDEMVWSLLGMQTAAEDPRFAKRVNLTAVFDPLRLGPLVYRFPAKEPRHSDRLELEDFGGKRSPLARLSGQTTLSQLSHFVDEERVHPDLPPGATVQRMIILSGHGDGVSGLLNGSPSGGVLTVRQLGELLKNDVAARQSIEPGRDARLEILGLEACAMGMLELCHELRKSVRWLVGTESFVQNHGWPYDRMLAPLFSRDDPKEVATEMVQCYHRYYTEFDIGGVSTDIAAVDLQGLESSGLVKAFADLAAALCVLLHDVEGEPAESGAAKRARVGQKASAPKRPEEVLLDALVVARWNAQSYSQDDFVDLEDWIVQLQHALRGGPTLGGVQEKCRAVLTALARAAPLSRYQGPAYQHSHGLSIYYPAAESRYRGSHANYKDLSFSQDTGWPEFLRLYLGKSRRGLRKEGEREKGVDGAELPYSYDEDGEPAQATVVPGSVRTPSNGTKRQTPSNGIRTPEELEGYVKNGPRAWYRDRRFETDDTDRAAPRKG